MASYLVKTWPTMMKVAVLLEYVIVKETRLHAAGALPGQRLRQALAVAEQVRDFPIQ